MINMPLKGYHIGIYFKKCNFEHDLTQFLTRCFTFLPNWLQVDEKRVKIDFFYSQINGGLEDTYVLSNCAYYNHNVPKFLCKSNLKHNTNQLVSKLLVTYFYYNKALIFSFNLSQTQQFYISTYKDFLFTLLSLYQKLSQM